MWHHIGSIVGGFLWVLRLPPPLKNNTTVAVHFQIQNKSDLYLRSSKNKFPSVIAEPFAPRVCNLSVLVIVRMVSECVWSRYSVRLVPGRRALSLQMAGESAYVISVLLLLLLLLPSLAQNTLLLIASRILRVKGFS